MNIRPYFCIFAILLFTLASCTESKEQVLFGTVSWIYDGDTIEVEGLGKVRLIGIDTPERETSGRDHYLNKLKVSSRRARDIYHAAKQYNIDHVKGRKVELSLDHPPRDRHGRLLAYVILPNGQTLNKVLLEKGLAVVYRKFSFIRKEEFISAEKNARKKKLGLWASNSH